MESGLIRSLWGLSGRLVPSKGELGEWMTRARREGNRVSPRSSGRSRRKDAVDNSWSLIHDSQIVKNNTGTDSSPPRPPLFRQLVRGLARIELTAQQVRVVLGRRSHAPVLRTPATRTCGNPFPGWATVSSASESDSPSRRTFLLSRGNSGWRATGRISPQKPFWPSICSDQPVSRSCAHAGGAAGRLRQPAGIALHRDLGSPSPRLRPARTHHD